MTDKADAPDTRDSQRRNLRDSGPVPLAWYEPETYEDIKALMIDGRAFASSHEKWEGHAKQVEAFFIAKGVPTVRVPVDPRDFSQWCVSRNRAPDAKERLAFSQWAAHSVSVPVARVDPVNDPLQRIEGILPCPEARVELQ